MLQASDLERKIGSKMGQNIKLNHWFIKLSSRKQTTIYLPLKKGTVHVHL